MSGALAHPVVGLVPVIGREKLSLVLSSTAQKLTRLKQLSVKPVPKEQNGRNGRPAQQLAEMEQRYEPVML